MPINLIGGVPSAPEAHTMPKVLIADDSRFQAQLLASYLRPKGFEVVFAGDALQAWTAALRSSPQLILLDINMPGGTGVEVLKRLRMSSRTQNIPVIVVSGEKSPAIEATVRDLGAPPTFYPSRTSRTSFALLWIVC